MTAIKYFSFFVLNILTVSLSWAQIPAVTSQLKIGNVSPAIGVPVLLNQGLKTVVQIRSADENIDKSKASVDPQERADNGIQGDLSHLSKAANPMDYQKSITDFGNGDQFIPYQIWAGNPGNTFGNSGGFDSVSDLMNQYRKAMNIGTNLPKSQFYENGNESPQLKSIMDKFQQSLSQSTLMRDGSNAYQNYQSPHNYPYHQAPLKTIYPDDTWDSVSKFTDYAMNTLENYDTQPESIKQNHPMNQFWNNVSAIAGQMADSVDQPGIVRSQINDSIPEFEGSPRTKHYYSIYSPNHYYNGYYYPNRGGLQYAYQPAYTYGYPLNYPYKYSHGYFKRSTPVTQLLNSNPQNRGITEQFSPIIYLGPVQSVDMISSALRSANGMTNNKNAQPAGIAKSALNLADGIARGNDGQVLSSGISMGTQIAGVTNGNKYGPIRFFKRSSPNGDIWITATDLADSITKTAANHRNYKNDQIIDSAGNIYRAASDLMGNIGNIALNQNTFGNNQMVESPKELEGASNENESISQNYPSKSIWNSATDLASNIAKVTGDDKKQPLGQLLLGSPESRTAVLRGPVYDAANDLAENIAKTLNMGLIPNGQILGSPNSNDGLIYRATSLADRIVNMANNGEYAESSPIVGTSFPSNVNGFYTRDGSNGEVWKSATHLATGIANTASNPSAFTNGQITVPFKTIWESATNLASDISRSSANSKPLLSKNK